MASRTKGGKGAKGHDHHNHQAQSDVPEKMEQPLDEQELESLYAWVDSIPLSRPKRNIARDFSDGVQVAEIAHFFFPSYVEMHNYTPANNTGGKLANWNVLNKKVFGKMNFELADDVINDLVCCKQGMIEKVLLMLQVKIKRAQYARQHQSDKPEADQHTSMSPGRKDGRTIKVGMDDTKGRLKTKQYSNFSGFTHQIEDYGHTITQHYLNNRGWSSGLQDQKPKPKKTGPAVIPKKRPGPIVESDSVPRYVVEEKEQEVLSRDETIQILNAKISRLEHLLHLKDMRIDDLQNRVESTRPTGIRR
ncbi:sperm flagellar protein 1-like isoform X16 [Mya arenaria]|uniref:sperm flagellar protein 1-like isoform X16 n=1 Tax=Mya arenaria TaxID=6604 RepID=UPI0022E97780|nr:sperm flagellar protein 1-like isoform X16 [Mya arenaria]